MKSRASRSKGNSRKTSRQESSKGSSSTSSASTPAKSDSTSSDSGSSLRGLSSMIGNVSKTLQKRQNTRSIQRLPAGKAGGTPFSNPGKEGDLQVGSSTQRISNLEAKVKECCS